MDEKKQNENDWAELAIGLVSLLIGAAMIIGAVYFGYSKFFKPSPGVVSLSAYFVDQAGSPVSVVSPAYEQSHLKIRGDAYQGSQPVKGGNVRLTVSTEDRSFRQSISFPLKDDGHFETEDPAFFPLRPGAQIHITADISCSQPSLSASSQIDLNSVPPASKLSLEVALAVGFVVLTGFFFYSFTGKKTHRKNRTAIIFSYVIIGIFLAVPILGPVFLLDAFPSAVDTMIGKPAGLVNTHTANQEADESQWALNIGGYSYISAETGTGSTAQAGVDAGSNTTTNQGTASSAGSITPVAAATSSSGKPGQVLQPSTSIQSAATAANNVSSSAGGAAPPKSAVATKSGGSQGSHQSVVKVQGGLVIPLYVIILSVLGGAINMTRKVPGFQKEGEDSESSLVRPISSLGSAVMRKITRSPGTAAQDANPMAAPPVGDTESETPPTQPATATAEDKKDQSLEEQGRDIDARIDPLVIEQIKRNCDTDATVVEIKSLVMQMQELFKSKKPDERLLKFNSFDDWFGSHPRLREVLGSNWRVELLNQYMYLISAPFLAIVAYYMIDLLGLTKQGVLVVISFSVGLISEKIVSWILGIATGYLRTDSSQAGKVT